MKGKTPKETAAIRTAEAEKACAILKARPLFAGQTDGSTEVNAARYDEFFKLLDGEKPDVVFTHWPVDSHRDHRVMSLLVYDAWLKSGKKFALFYFEVDAGRRRSCSGRRITWTSPRRKSARRRRVTRTPTGRSSTRVTTT